MKLIPGFVFTLLLTANFSLAGQALVDFQHLGDIDRDSLTRLFTISAIQDVSLYRVTYTTLGSDGLQDTASGLTVVPMESSKGIILYQHGTSSGPESVPSSLQIADALILIASVAACTYG